jgi:hypothetical protein
MPLTKDQQAAYSMRRSARAQGWKFVELHLKDTYQHDTLASIKVHGIIDITGQKGTVKNGRQTYTIYLKTNGVLRFDYNEDKAVFEAWLPIDENEPGTFSEHSRNLDFLASHWHNQIFTVADYNGFEDEVKARVKVMKAKAAERDAETIREHAKMRAQAELEVEEDLGAQESALEEQLKKVRLQKGLIQKDAPVEQTPTENAPAVESPQIKAAATRALNKKLKEQKEAVLQDG